MVNRKLFMAFCGILADKDDDCDKDDKKEITNEPRQGD
jgi:hypothetical protein